MFMRLRRFSMKPMVLMRRAAVERRVRELRRVGIE